MKHYRSIVAAIGISAILLGALPIRPVYAGAGDEGFEQEANGYHVALQFNGHAKTGENRVEVRITGSGGQPAEGFTVEVEAEAGEAHGDEAADAHGEDVKAQPEAADEEAHGAAEQPDRAVETEMPDDMHMADGDEHTPRPPESGMDGMEMGTPEPEPQADGHGEENSAEDSHIETGTAKFSGEQAEASEIEPCKVETPCTDEDEHAEGEQAGGHGEGKVLLKPAKEAGIYHGEVFFPESGDWAVKIRFASPDGSLEEHVDFNVDVIETGPNWPVLVGFFGINTTIITAAAVLKRKSIPAIAPRS